MEFKYIFAIVVLGIFFLLIFVSFAVLERGKIKDEKLQTWIRELYASREVNKYDYDAEELDEIPLPKLETVTDDAVDKAEEVKEDVHIDDPYGKIDIEGIEEITGTYNGDK